MPAGTNKRASSAQGTTKTDQSSACARKADLVLCGQLVAGFDSIVELSPMEVGFFGMLATIPDGWENRSTITFQAPQAAIEAPRLLQPRGAGSPGNVAITWMPLPKGDAPAAAYLESQLRALPSLFERFAVTGRGDAGDGGAPLPFVEFAFDAQDRRVAQILCARPLAGDLVIVTGTAAAPSFAQLRPHFIDVARSIRRESS
jgi:hypothetical protein